MAPLESSVHALKRHSDAHWGLLFLFCVVKIIRALRDISSAKSLEKESKTRQHVHCATISELQSYCVVEFCFECIIAIPHALLFV